MPKKTLDLDDLLGPVDDPRLIPRIHNYCNRRCERCAFAERCLLYRSQRDAMRKHPGRGPRAHARAAFEHTYDLLRAWCEREGIDFDEIQRTADSSEVEAELRKMDETRADPLQKRAECYTHAALNLVDALARAAPFHAWPLGVREAIDTIMAIAILVSSKVHRALSGLAVRDDAWELDAVQTDWNGSAKIARIVVAESKAAWETVIAAGHAAADAPIHQVPDLLDQVDHAIAERFPRAMEFVRPGFDEPDVAAGAPSRLAGFEPRPR